MKDPAFHFPKGLLPDLPGTTVLTDKGWQFARLAGVTGHGIVACGGSSGTSGHGIRATGHGINAVGYGACADVTEGSDNIFIGLTQTGLTP